MTQRRAQSKTELVIRSLLFDVFFFATNLIGCFVCLIGLVLPYRRGARAVIATFFMACIWVERIFIGLHWDVKGKENLPPGCCILALKHQSLWETYNLLAWFGEPAIVMKQELMRIPLWGWYAKKIGAIPIDRGGGMKTLLRMAKAAETFKEQGRPIVLFPQGTRLPVDAWKPYGIGVGVLAEQLRVPVVPVALNSGLYWPKGAFIKRAGRVSVEILPPIPPDGTAREIVGKLEAALEAASERLSLAAGGPPISRRKERDAIAESES